MFDTDEQQASVPPSTLVPTLGLGRSKLTNVDILATYESFIAGINLRPLSQPETSELQKGSKDTRLANDF